MTCGGTRHRVISIILMIFAHLQHRHPVAPPGPARRSDAYRLWTSGLFTMSFAFQLQSMTSPFGPVTRRPSLGFAHRHDAVGVEG